MIEKLESATGAEPLKTDPDDPWALEGLVKSASVFKVKCPICGYYYTQPFEKECPICKFTQGKEHPPCFAIDEAAIEQISQLAAAAPKPKPPSAPKEKAQHAAKPKAAAQPDKGKGDALNKAFSLCNFRMTRLSKCYKHPEADKLIVAEADLGGGKIETLVTGLIPHYQPADLEGRVVCCVCNLKSKKMMGIEGHVMLLAATDAATRRLQLLEPPPGCQPGERIFPANFPLLKALAEGHPLAVAPPSETPESLAARLTEMFSLGSGAEADEVPKKQFEKVVEGFKVAGERPCFYGTPLICGRGPITVPQVADGSEFH
jgi:methionine--tRNA ligase beta chain